MGAVCDIYDALTSQRVYKSGWSPVEAIDSMNSWEGHLDRAVLVSFMRSIGVYPVGLLVELRSGRLGVTLPNGRRASRPRARAFFDCKTRAFIEVEDVLLDDNLRYDQVLCEVSPDRWGLPDWQEIKFSLLNGGNIRAHLDEAGADLTG